MEHHHQSHLYIGTKIIRAQSMTRAAYNNFRGWTLPADEDGADEGYLVEYMDGGKPNTTTHEGYVSWSPRAQFDNAYRKTSCLSFGLAIDALKQGLRVARHGWNGKGMFLFLVPGSVFKVSRAPLLGIYPEGTEINYHSHIDMRTASGEIIPWLASQTDMLADDWHIVDHIHSKQ